MPDLKFYINAVEQEDAIKFARFKDDVDELFAGLVAEYNLSSSAEEFQPAGCDGHKRGLSSCSQV